MILWARSIFGHNTKRGMVELTCPEPRILCTPDEARAFATHIFEAAEAAEMDEIVMRWVTDDLAIKNDTDKGTLLLRFRQIREQMQKERDAEKHGL